MVMSLGGLCHVCEAANAEERCDHCGALVCSDHHDADRGVCVECAAEMGVGDPLDAREGGTDHPDVDRYRF
jgi:hypothetical protein